MSMLSCQVFLFLFLFEVHSLRNKTYMDGSVKFSLDIPAAIEKCREKGFGDKDIVIDAILCSSKKISEKDVSNIKSLGVLMRTVEIYLYDMTMRDLDEISHVFPNVTLRYVIAPNVTLPSGIIPLQFDPKEIEIMIQQGISEAKKTVLKGEGKNYKELFNEYLIEKYSSMLGKNVDLDKALSLQKEVNNRKDISLEKIKQKLKEKKGFLKDKNLEYLN